MPDRQEFPVARQLARRARAKGLSEIMIYDDERRLRIQALGSRPPLVLRVTAGPAADDP
jgi:hypothetical protein